MSPESQFKRDKDLMDHLFQRFAKDGPRITSWREWTRFMIKKNLWIMVIEGSRALKRFIDIVGSVVGLIVLSPVFAITALAVKLEDGGPVFYGQARVGKWGKHFTMYKFRSMVVRAEAMKEALLDRSDSPTVIFKMKKDPRITRTGVIIRKLSIDELPQLWNVLKGDMSLVGPRPHPPGEVEHYRLKDRRRLEAIPGLTCIWQVSGRSDIDFDKQVGLDVQYIRNQSFREDLRLLLKTIPAVLSGRGAY